MFEGIDDEIAAIGAQDPRAPLAYQKPGLPFKKLDSPYYRMALRRVARAAQPRSYLEIGVKEGGSLSVVLEASRELDRLVLCDFFTVNEKKRAHQDSAATVLAERGFTGKTTWLDGSSTVTVPTLTEMFDLIGVDGSHRRSICATDLRNAFPLLKPGGHMVVDDLSLFEDNRLSEVFDAFAAEYADTCAVVYKNTAAWPGVGVLRREA
ncbi:MULTISPECIES: class I SAM-dependent methyltransferase [unclassified Streptomyces]|uniref:class I SAM-dependent methyltransferase n=1 Tax=unclassified Streptomyces TaxID=2593676 RepID=UPI002E1E5905|nr:class I SAM-dependent methyltransferase [Streptomyces sp. NBC_01023]